MVRVPMTVYKNSALATTCSIFGTIGWVAGLSGICSGEFVMGIVLIPIGIALLFLGSFISRRKAAKGNPPGKRHTGLIVISVILIFLGVLFIGISTSSNDELMIPYKFHKYGKEDVYTSVDVVSLYSICEKRSEKNDIVVDEIGCVFVDKYGESGIVVLDNMVYYDDLLKDVRENNAKGKSVTLYGFTKVIGADLQKYADAVTPAEMYMLTGERQLFYPGDVYIEASLTQAHKESGAGMGVGMVVTFAGVVVLIIALVKKKKQAPGLNQQEVNVVRALATNKFVVPAESENGNLKKIIIPYVTFNDGRKFAAVFTEHGLMTEYYQKTMDSVTLPNLLRDVYNEIKTNNAEGIVINPGPKMLVLSKAMLAEAFKEQ